MNQQELQHRYIIDRYHAISECNKSAKGNNTISQGTEERTKQIEQLAQRLLDWSSPMRTAFNGHHVLATTPL